MKFISVGVDNLNLKFTLSPLIPALIRDEKYILSPPTISLYYLQVEGDSVHSKGGGRHEGGHGGVYSVCILGISHHQPHGVRVTM
jgi:hypothetical protein